MSCLGIAVGADRLMAEQGAQRLLDIVEASTPVEQRAMHSSLLNFANMNGGELGTRACRATLFRDKKLVNTLGWQPESHVGALKLLDNQTGVLYRCIRLTASAPADTVFVLFFAGEESAEAPSVARVQREW